MIALAREAVPVVFVAFAVLASCGARTGLDTGRVVVTNVACTSDAQCDDAIACTFDRCDEALRVCTHVLQDAECDDGIFCDGVEQCDALRGCVETPRSCDDGVACTDDVCDEPKKTCDHVPDNAKCPVSQACDAARGCEQRAFVHDFETLFDVRLPSGVMTTIGPTTTELTDVALSPDNTLWAISFDGIATVNQSTGAATPSQSLTQSLNGADFGPDGTLFVSGDSSLFTLDPQTGALSLVASFPEPLASSGDVAFVGARLLATGAGSEESDELVEFDLAAGTSSVIGSIGFSCVWGLAAYETSLYGFTCTGKIIAIDTTSGHASLVAAPPGAQFWGASAR